MKILNILNAVEFLEAEAREEVDIHLDDESLSGYDTSGGTDDSSSDDEHCCLCGRPGTYSQKAGVFIHVELTTSCSEVSSLKKTLHT